MILKPKPTEYFDFVTGKVVQGYLPEVLEKQKKYRVLKFKKNAWGTLVKTDRISEWVNVEWFREEEK